MKMTNVEFIEEMKAYASKYGEVEVKEITRPNITYTGLLVRAGNGVPTPVVNLTKAYSQYSAGTWAIEDCYKYATDILTMNRPPQLDTTQITEWEKARTHLYIRLCNKATNGIQRPLKDMFEVPYLQMSEDGVANVRVTPDLVTLWGIDEDTLFAEAKENQEIIRPAKITPLEKVMGVDTGLPVYIVTTDNEICGASAVLYNSTADKLKELFGEKEFYLLPSSIHEMIAIPAYLINDVRELKLMVSAINDSDVEADDQLTNAVYTYRENEEYNTTEFVKVI